MNFNPKVSIIIPVYNGSNYLRAAIDSALAQTYKNLEVIVVNDGSTDGGRTEEIALSYGNELRYLRKENGGVASALNVGIREMTGEYFSWLSHDDLYYPRKVESQVAFLSGLEDRNVVLYSDFEYMDPSGVVIGVKRIKHIDQRKFRLELIIGDPVNGCTVLIPKQCFEKVGLFSEHLRTTQDYDMWFRLAKVFKFVFVPEVLMRSRVHSEQGVRITSTHYLECTELFIRLIQALSHDEICSFYKGPLSLFYAAVAIRIKLRGYTESADFIMGLAKKYRAGGDLSSFPAWVSMTVLYRLLNKKLKPSYWWRRLQALARHTR